MTTDVKNQFPIYKHIRLLESIHVNSNIQTQQYLLSTLSYSFHTVLIFYRSYQRRDISS